MRRTAVFFVLATAAAVEAADTGAPFGLPSRFDIGASRSPTSVAAGDFNGDAKVDIVVASEGANDVVILFGDGRGGFRQGPSAPAGADPTEIFVGDFNRDGRPDLAIPDHDTRFVTILLGDGKVFRAAPGSPLTVRSRPHPHTVDGCDANSDGNIDLVIDSWEDNGLTLLLGDGKGGFQTPGSPIEVGRKPYRNLKLRDVDGDGRCDIVAPSYGQGVVTVLLGDGRGHFKAGAPIPAGPAPFTVGIGDLNRDGRPDLALSNYSGQITDASDDAISFLLGDGKGGFRLGPRLSTGRGPFQLSAGDVNGDGFADVATADYGSSDLTVAFGGPDGLSSTRTHRVPVPDKPERVLLVDLNGDHRADAVATSSEGHDVIVLLAN